MECRGSRDFRFDSPVPTRGIDRMTSLGKVFARFCPRCFSRARKEGRCVPAGDVCSPEPSPRFIVLMKKVRLDK